MLKFNRKKNYYKKINQRNFLKNLFKNLQQKANSFNRLSIMILTKINNKKIKQMKNKLQNMMKKKIFPEEI